MRQVGYRKSAKVADTGRTPTKNIWDHIPWSAIQDGEREGWVFWDDFINMPDLAAADAKDTLYATFATASTTIEQAAAGGSVATSEAEYGELVMTLAAADNDEAYLVTGGNKGNMVSFELQGTQVPHTIAFEARIRVSTLLGSAFVGFCEEGLAVADGLFDDSGVFTNKDYLGFSVVEATPTVIDFGYNKESGTDVKIITGLHTLVADTYVKLGFLYSYKNPAARQIKIYLNGVRNATYTTKAQIDDATNFPGGEEMQLMAAVKNVTDIKNLTMDWWRAALVVNK